MRKSYCLLLLLLFTSVVFAGKEPGFSAFTVPYDYFVISLPDGWEFLCTDWFGERNYLFSPVKVTRSEIEQGVDLEAFFKVKICRVPDNMLNLPPKELIKRNIEHMENVYKQAGYNLRGEIGGARTIMGINGYTASLFSEEDENPSFLFLGVKGELGYQIFYGCDADKALQYNPLLLKMLEGMQLLDYASKEELTGFRDSNNQFFIKLPKSWSMKEKDDGKTAQLFVSREAIINKDDFYKVGVTITKIRNASTIFANTGSDLDLVKQWGSIVIPPSQNIDVELHAFRGDVNIAGKTGFLVERSFVIKGFNVYTQEYRLILAKNNNLYDIVMEAPVMEFEIYREVFNEAINSLVLN